MFTLIVVESVNVCCVMGRFTLPGGLPVPKRLVTVASLPSGVPGGHYLRVSAGA